MKYFPPTLSLFQNFSFLPKGSRHLYFIPITALACIIILISLSLSPLYPSRPSSYVDDAASASIPSSSISSPPSFAYFLSGSKNDADRLFRLVLAIYHPKNLYLLHIDQAAPLGQRDRLARVLHDVPAFRSARNVHVLGRADLTNTRGSSALASMLHGAAVLLRLSCTWDWFINLSADAYPLVTQDDLLHVFSFIPKDINFMQHSSYIGWRESHRLKYFIVDPSLYLSSKVDAFYATQKRDLPNAYRIFTGSPSVILSQKFVEHIVLGVDNLPRALLMYYANTPSSHKNYLQTVICNSQEFSRTIVSDNLRCLSSGVNLNNITLCGAAFGSRFYLNDPALNLIDKLVLNRSPRTIVPGGWCLGRGNADPCAVWGNPDALIPGPGATRLARNIAKLLADNLQSHQCSWDGFM